MNQSRLPVAIIGAGPAGLTAAYLIAKAQRPVIVFEADPVYVGGISRTVSYKGFHFDIGGHRFFSKSKAVEDLWTEILPDGMLERPRISRILYRGQFLSYPLRAIEAVTKLGVFEAALCVLSYARARIRPVRQPRNFEEWVTNQFGARLFRIFFKTYTEKVWGISCREISADWAAQRIKGLSLGSAIYHALMPARRSQAREDVVKTLIDTFRYPREGPGMLWEACAAKVREMGGTIQLGSRVTGCRYDERNGTWWVSYQDTEGSRHQISAEHVISSAPLRELVAGLEPAVPAHVAEAARQLKYRDFLTVVLIAQERQPLQDQWLYIHDPDVKVGRIQNFKAWAPDMVPDPSKCCFGLEYFCFEGDGMWTASDAALLELARNEIDQTKVARAADILDGCIVRQPKAYPVYDDHYADHVQVIREEIEAHYPHLHVVGRNGMHKYNNQDHAMMTAMLTVENILAGHAKYDVWRVNQDAEYHEAGASGSDPALSGIRAVPTLAREH